MVAGVSDILLVAANRKPLGLLVAVPAPPDVARAKQILVIFPELGFTNWPVKQLTTASLAGANLVASHCANNLLVVKVCI